MLEIKHFCKAYEGAYICTITDSKNEDYSESLSVILKFDGMSSLRNQIISCIVMTVLH